MRPLITARIISIPTEYFLRVNEFRTLYYDKLKLVEQLYIQRKEELPSGLLQLFHILDFDRIIDLARLNRLLPAIQLLLYRDGLGPKPSGLQFQVEAMPVPGNCQQDVGASCDVPEKISQMKLNFQPPPEYLERVEDLRSLYYDKLKIVKQRCIMDRQKIDSRIQKLLEVFTYKRICSVELLNRLEPRIQPLLDQECITYPFMEQLKMLTSCKKPPAAPTSSAEDIKEEKPGNNFMDHWKGLEHLKIEVPESVQKAIALGASKLQMKRKIKQEADFDEENIFKVRKV